MNRNYVTQTANKLSFETSSVDRIIIMALQVVLTGCAGSLTSIVLCPQTSRSHSRKLMTGGCALPYKQIHTYFRISCLTIDKFVCTLYVFLNRNENGVIESTWSNSIIIM